MKNIAIIPYEGKFKEQVGKFIISIQRDEFNVPITLDDQPDLADIENFYQSKNGNFWCVVNDQDQLIGTIALIDIGNKMGVIRKMFVHADYRSGESKIALKLLLTLEEWAKSKAMHSLYLGTRDSLVAANKFYNKNGYRQIEAVSLPENFPKMKVDNTFFEKNLD